MRSKKLFCILLICFMSICNYISSWSAIVTVDKDNIRYTVDLETNEAEVYGPVSSSTTITNLVIPDYIEYEEAQIPVTSIRDYAFSSNKNLRGSLTIGDNVQTIGERAFASCSGFNSSLTIGDNVQTIGNYAFYSCSGFTGSLTIGDNVLTIGEFAFEDCSGFKGSLTIGDNVRTIGDRAFDGCSGFTGPLRIPMSVYSIGELAFRNCKSLTGSLTIPNSVLIMGEGAFEHCSSFNGSLIIPDFIDEIPAATFIGCSGFTGNLNIPDNVRNIGAYAFSDCSGLTGSLTIGDNVQSIGNSAFSHCSGFTGSLTIGDNVQSIGNSAFSYCSGFTGELIIPESVKEIGSGCFASCDKLSSLVITSSNTVINYQAFQCHGLETITCLGTIPPKCIYGAIGSMKVEYVFSPIIYDKPLYVPAESINLYKNATEWEKFKYINPISIEATAISLNKTELNLLIGQEEILIATLTPEDATTEIVWSTDDSNSIISVDQNGKVTALAVGEATVKATAGDVSATCKVTVNPVVASSITLNVQDMTLLVGQSDKLTATVTPENTSDKTIAWKSDNEAIAPVGTDGTVTAVSVGVANITATCGEATATCKVTVNPVVASSVTLNVQDMTLLVGQSDKLTATVTPENTTDKTVTWKSDNEAVATVGTDGTVTAVSVGTANITATCGEATATCKVTVNPVAASSVTLNVQDMTLLVGQTDKLTATVTPENTTDKTITWKSDNEAVATVGTDGTVTAVSVGVANITATCGKATATCKVMVNPVVASSVTLNVQDMTLLVGQTDKLTATVTPENTTDKTITWKSDNEDVATVSEDGTVTAVSVGMANITATCGEATAICKITVNPVIASSVTLNVQDMTLLVGQTDKLTATVTPENTTDKTVTWKSDNEAVATVSEDGTVTAVSVGTANITATCGEATATCKVTVNPVVASGVTINVQDMTLLVGQTDKLTATVTPENTTDKTITWKSDNEDVATVGADGTVTAVSVGVANISATCGEATATCKVTVNPVTASSITLNVEDMTLLVGQSDKLTATVEPQNTTDSTISWKSDNEAIATVGTDGTVTAVSVGTANITATCGEATATCKVTVNPVTASSITLNVEDMTLLVGQSDKLTATVEPQNTTDSTISWKSDNEAIATVSADGTVTAVSVGTANITATCGEATATCKVTVNPVEVSSIELSLQDVTLLIGTKTTLTAKIYPENATNQQITWTSDDSSIASIDDTGTISALQVGVTTITAKCGDVSATCKVTVTPVSPTSIELNIKDMILYIGQSETIQAVVRPANTTYPTITWKSDDESIAKVSAEGKVTGVKEGVTIITATCGEVSASCKVTVNPIPASNIEITTGDVTLTIGSTTDLVAKVSPDNTTHPDVEWLSSDTNIATITAEGTVTAVNIGTAIITAKCGNVSATCTVTVIPVPSEGIVISPTSISMLLGEEVTLTATVFPENTTDKTVTWGSDNPGVQPAWLRH